MDHKTAQAIYQELKEVSVKVLEGLGMKSEPYEPIVRTCKFLYGVPLGILYHYTGGVDAVKSMRWANDPTWGNTKSSWHVTIFDRITDDKAGELWVKFANSTLRRWFPVPTIIMADWRWGTWHGNWTNDVTLGVENRNTGHSGWQKLGTDGIERLGKTPLVLILGSKKWEPYTREQIVANVNIGRLLNGWIGGNHTLDPNWILGHQCVWATKLDPGPFFPIHDIRIEIFNDDDLSEAAWLLKFSLAPDTNIEDDAHWSKPEDVRHGVHLIPPVSPKSKPVVSDLWVMENLNKLGFNTGVGTNCYKLTDQIRWFQHSTEAYREDNPERVLKPDGVVGPLTKAEIERRLSQFGL